MCLLKRVLPCTSRAGPGRADTRRQLGYEMQRWVDIHCLCKSSAACHCTARPCSMPALPPLLDSRRGERSARVSGRERHLTPHGNAPPLAQNRVTFCFVSVFAPSQAPAPASRTVITNTATKKRTPVLSGTFEQGPTRCGPPGTNVYFSTPEVFFSWCFILALIDIHSNS